MSEKERCSCGAWMKNFDTSFYVEGIGTIPHNVHMCVNPRCPNSVSKDFIPPVPRESDSKRMKELEAICADCDKDPEDRDGDPCEYCRTWKEIKEIKSRQQIQRGQNGEEIKNTRLSH